MRDALKFLSLLAVGLLPLSVHAVASEADTLRKLTALGEQGSAAAEQGYAQAAYNLSMVYQHGHGVAKDPALALRYLLITERSVPEPMRPRFATALTKVRDEATPAQIAQAEAAAAAWTPKPTPLTSRALNGIREVEKLPR